MQIVSRHRLACPRCIPHVLIAESRNSNECLHLEKRCSVVFDYPSIGIWLRLAIHTLRVLCVVSYNCDAVRFVHDALHLYN